MRKSFLYLGLILQSGVTRALECTGFSVIGAATLPLERAQPTHDQVATVMELLKPKPDSAELVPLEINRSRIREALPLEFHFLDAKLAQGQNDLKNLPDGVYVFLVDAAGNTVYSHRSPNLDAKPDEAHLATHPGLLRFMRKKLGKRTIILGAGEFHILNGQVCRVNNRSGLFSFNNGRKNLDYSISQLMEHGLEVKAGTQHIAVGIDQDMSGLHARAEEASLLYIKHNKSEGYKVLENLLYKLQKKYPGKIPGSTDAEKLNEIIWADDSEVPLELRKYIITLQQILNQSLDDGLFLSLANIEEHGGSKQLEKTKALIKTLLKPPEPTSGAKH